MLLSTTNFTSRAQLRTLNTYIFSAHLGESSCFLRALFGGGGGGDYEGYVGGRWWWLEVSGGFGGQILSDASLSPLSELTCRIKIMIGSLLAAVLQGERVVDVLDVTQDSAPLHVSLPPCEKRYCDKLIKTSDSRFAQRSIRRSRCCDGHVVAQRGHSGWGAVLPVQQEHREKQKNCTYFSENLQRKISLTKVILELKLGYSARARRIR